MKVLFDKSFYKSLQKLPTQQIKNKVAQIIIQAEKTTKIQDIPHIKKLEGFKNYYRIRIGDYRIGMELEKTDTMRFIIIAHRKDIYNVFP